MFHVHIFQPFNFLFFFNFTTYFMLSILSIFCFNCSQFHNSIPCPLLWSPTPRLFGFSFLFCLFLLFSSVDRLLNIHLVISLIRFISGYCLPFFFDFLSTTSLLFLMYAILPFCLASFIWVTNIFLSSFIFLE